jgi:tetratricopeptide (TPR) repeat protein
MLATLFDTTTRTLRIARHANAYLMALLLLVPWSGITAASDDAPDTLAQIESDDEARAALMQDVRAYREQIGRIEQENGAYAPGLSEQLLGLGLALQRNGDHLQAIEVFKRGVHLARINEGLYSDRQMALLQGEIASQVAIGEYEEADERQRYLYRVQAETLSDVSRGRALVQHALWQRQAYEAGIGEEPFSRLVRMWSLYRLALTEISEAEGQTSPLLLPPLYGMLRSQYLISGFVGETSSGRFRTRSIYSDEESRQLGFRNQSYKQGSAVIRAIYDVRSAQETSTVADEAGILLMLGDWQFWHGKRNDALSTYADLYRELEATDAAKTIQTNFFATPQPLPALAGVRALPDTVEEGSGHLLVEFGVNDRGRVVDLERLDDYAHNDAIADNIMRRMRQITFRPRIDDGMPVDTAGLRWAYDTSMWQ